MNISEAVEMARDGVTGVVTVDEPWVYKLAPNRDALFPSPSGQNIAAPGAVELEYLAELVDVRAWKPEDAR